ncbi:hypothetical protein CFP56_028473 [Quercus suber]|uniref:Uncharacterized protein n=1 Tax=Quercus suber TaxID=58331 RepID=A0AAW0JVE6_QUESU
MFRAKCSSSTLVATSFCLSILAFIFILLFKLSSTLPNNKKPPKLPIIENLP